MASSLRRRVARSSRMLWSASRTSRSQRRRRWHLIRPASRTCTTGSHTPILEHHCIVDALERGQGTRVEALMQEHINPVKENLNLPGIRVKHGAAFIRAGESITRPAIKSSHAAQHAAAVNQADLLRQPAA